MNKTKFISVQEQIDYIVCDLITELTNWVQLSKSSQDIDEIMQRLEQDQNKLQDLAYVLIDIEKESKK